MSEQETNTNGQPAGDEAANLVAQQLEGTNGKDTDLGGDVPPEVVEEGKDTKIDADKKGEEGKDEENTLFGKPEAYDYQNIKLPENVQLDEAMTGKFNEYASKLNLSQKGADDLMTMAVELTGLTHQRTVEAMGKLTEAKIESYKQLLNTDSEVGGAKLKESLATANLAYEGFFADEDLRLMIAENGLNAHPKFIKALKAIGSQMKQDTIHASQNPAGDRKSREEILYPSMDEK